MNKKLLGTAVLAVMVFVGLQVSNYIKHIKPIVMNQPQEVSSNTIISPKVGMPVANVGASSLQVNNISKSSSLPDIKKLELDAERTVLLFGPITENADEYVSILKDLESQSSDPIYLLIDSPGGSVVDGASIVSQIESSKAPVYTICTKICASMAAVIHQYGHKRLAVNRTILMFHPASGGAEGQLDNMLSLLNTFAKYIEKFDTYIAKRANVEKNKFKQSTAFELWIDAEDAKATGFVDDIVSIDLNKAKRKSNKLKSIKSESSSVRTIGSPGGAKGTIVLESK